MNFNACLLFGISKERQVKIGVRGTKSKLMTLMDVTVTVRSGRTGANRTKQANQFSIWRPSQWLPVCGRKSERANARARRQVILIIFYLTPKFNHFDDVRAMMSMSMVMMMILLSFLPLHYHHHRRHHCVL